MDARRQQEIDRLLEEALGQVPAERLTFLTRACTGDPALLRDVTVRLSWHEGRDSEPTATTTARPPLETSETPCLAMCPTCGKTVGIGRQCLRCGRDVEPAGRGASLSGRYLMAELLGRGGMGIVFRAHDTALDEPVAVKLLLPEARNRPEIAERFRTEIRLARRIRHRNVCAIHEYGEDGDLAYIVMEHVPGADLKRVLADRGTLPFDEAFAVAEQVAEGLDAVHAAGIVHRDLKTRNVMMTSDGVVRLMDFGIAKLLDGPAPAEQAGLTETGQIIGTPDYMSPEQARGERLDRRSDIYSLGVVVFELFTGRLPFSAETPMATILLHLNAPPPLDGRAAAGLPSSLRPVLRRALAKSPSDRYSSAAEMATALRGAAKGNRGRVVPGGAGRLGSRRHRAWFAAGAGALCLALAWLIGGPDPRPLGSSPRPPEPEAAAFVPLPPPVEPVTLPSSPTPASPLVKPSVRPAAHGPADRRDTPSPSPANTDKPSTRVEAATTTDPPPTPETSTSLPDPPVPAPEGWLQLLIIPWAEVSVDDRHVGTTPMRAIALPPGRRMVLLSHPDYGVVHREVVINEGQTTELEVDLRAPSGH